MAQQQQNISITSPGYFGLNLEDSPVDLPQEFCTVADNAVIDSLGRLAAREGFKAFTPTGLPSAEYDVQSLGRVVDGNTVRYIAGVDVGGTPEIWELTDLNLSAPTRTVLALPGGYSLTTANIQIVDFAGRGIIIVPGAEMLVLSGGTLALASAQAGWLPPTDAGGTAIHTTFSPECATSAYGRLWVSGVEGDEETIYYSDVLNPAYWLDLKAAPTYATNTAGALNVSENWPIGKDRIVGMAAHNSAFVVFGRSSILVWGNPQGDPAATDGIFLADTIENIGLVNRDAITSDGKDILFMDDTGLRSLGRTIQEKSAPIGDLTRTVRSAISSDSRKARVQGGVELVFSPKHSFVLIIMRTAGVVWVADTRTRLQDGSFRMTRWPSTEVSSALYVEANEQLLLGLDTADVALAEYEEYVDYNTTYVFSYASPIMSFGDSTRLKIVKQVDYSILAGAGDAEATAKVDYFGFRNRELSKTVSIEGGQGTEQFNSGAEFAEGYEFGTGAQVLRSYRYNAGSSGENVRISFNVPISGNSCSMVGINVQTKIGRIV